MNNEKEFALHVPKRKPYFEGWYCKGMEETFNYAIIIGIHYDASGPFAFIQFMDTLSNRSRYEVFTKEDLHVETHPFTLQLKDNVLTQHRLTLHLQGICANLQFSTFIPLHQTPYMPTIMGPFAYFPMECVHSVISLRHTIKGTLEIDQNLHELSGIGYLEKDRGSSFPQNYLWFQANHPTKEQAIFLSIASIPLPGFSFTGLICVLYLFGKQYRFATYLGGRITHFHIWKKQSQTHIDLNLKQGKLRLELALVQQDQCHLHAPYQGSMNLKIGESLNSYGHILFAKGDHILYEETLTQAGLEVVGWQMASPCGDL